jgi:hypothetical protein
VYYIYGDQMFGPYDTVWGAKISSDNKHYAFAAQKDNQYWMVTDGKEQALDGELLSYQIGPSGELVYAVDTGTAVNIVFNGKELPDSYDEVEELSISPDGQHLAFWGKTDDEWAVVKDDRVYNSINMYYYYQFGYKHYAILWGADSQNIAYFTTPEGDYANWALNGIAQAPIQLSKVTVTLYWYVNNHDLYEGEEDLFGPYINPQALVQYLLEGAPAADDPDSVQIVNGMLAYVQTEDGKYYAMVGAGKEGPYANIEGALTVSGDGKHYAYIIDTEKGQQLVVDGAVVDLAYDGIYRVQFTQDQSIAYFGKKDGKVYSVIGIIHK